MPLSVVNVKVTELYPQNCRGRPRCLGTQWDVKVILLDQGSNRYYCDNHRMPKAINAGMEHSEPVVDIDTAINQALAATQQTASFSDLEPGKSHNYTSQGANFSLEKFQCRNGPLRVHGGFVSKS